MKPQIDNMPPGRREEVERLGNKYKLTTHEVVKMKINKFMDNPDKEVIIPEFDPNKGLKPPPEFVRNVWGSAAGVGSGDFHIYRGIRRREYARQEYLDKKTEEEAKNTEFQKQQAELQKLNEIKSDKRRAKRLKKKASKQKRKANQICVNNNDGSDSDMADIELVETSENL